MLFSSEKESPIFTEDVTITNEKNKEVELNWKIDNTDGYYKGEFYLGYLTNDVDLGTLKPYDRDYENSDIMSSITNLWIRRQLFPGITTEVLPDLENDDGLSDNIGINPDITVYEDYTDLVINNETLFGYAVYLQLAVKCMEIYTASLRSNRLEREAEKVLLRVTQEIEGDNRDGFVFIKGLKPSLTTEIARIQVVVKELRGGYFADEMTVHTLQ